jgi:tetratricopeptide (TPR) repeat protein
MDGIEMSRVAALCVAGAVLGATPAIAQKPRHEVQCGDWGGKQFAPDVRISGCDATIRSGGYGRTNLADAYLHRGIAYYSKGDLNRALAEFNKAIRLHPKTPNAFTYRGNIYAARNEPDRAIADYAETIRLDSTSAAAFWGRGIAYIKKSDYTRAFDDLGEVTRLQPSNAIAWNNRCQLRVILGRELQQALAECNEALRLRPDYAKGLDTRGFAYLKLGQLENAIADYDAALKLDPKLPDSLYARGIAKLRKRDAAGGNADIAAAKAIQADIADQFARWGLKPD